MKKIYILFLSLISFSALSQVPEFTVAVCDSSSTGYYFLSQNQLLTIMILDGKGNVVYYRNGIHGGDFTLQPNGMMSYSDQLQYYFMDSTFTVVDSITTKNLDQRDTHELQVLPNGHFLLLGSDLETMDLSQYYWDGQYGSDTATVRCSVIQEQDENRNVVFEWHAKDHFVFDEADTFFLLHAPIYNWTHANAIEMDYDGNILLSTRNFSEITKINRSDSSIIWRLGGTQNQFTFVNSPVPFYGQHDIRRLSNGHITLFDNGNHYIPHGCRALEFELDETNKIATQTWSYTFDSAKYSISQGNVQRLANSNSVVNYGSILNDSVVFLVVDTSGSKVFQMDGTLSYRAFNYPSLPWQLHRPQIICFDSLGAAWLDAGAGYSTYGWNNGDSTRIIPLPAVVDTYYVFVPYGQDGFISSEQFIVSNPSNICGTSAAASNLNNSGYITVFPNPANERLTLAFHLLQRSEVSISLWDIRGRQIIQSENEILEAGDHSVFFDLSKIAPGLYFIKLNEQVVKFAKR